MYVTRTLLIVSDALKNILYAEDYGEENCQVIKFI